MTFRKIIIWFALLPSLLMANESDLSMEVIPDIGLSTFQIITEESKKSEPATNKMTSWNERLQRSFEEMGITFPEGARVTYNPLAHSLHHYNTKENHDRLNRLVSYRSDDSRTQVQIDAHFVTFPKTTIDQALRKNRPPILSTSDIISLWKQNRASCSTALKPKPEAV